MRSGALLIALLLLSTAAVPATSLSVTSHRNDRTAMEEEGNSTIVYPIDEGFLEYPSYDEVTTRLQMLAMYNPDIVSITDLSEMTDNGATWYDRSIWGVKISDGQDVEDIWYNDPDEEDILIVGLHHAREWMSLSVCLYFIEYLVHYYDSSPIDNDMDGLLNEDPLNGIDDDGDGEDDDGDNETVARMDGHDNDGDGLIDEGIDEDASEALATYLVNHREIWVVPMLNPDGYEYDRTISEPGDGGGWRKNQRDQSINGGKRSSGDGSFNSNTDGVDLNRNYPFEWNRNEKGYVVDTNGVTVVSDSRNEWDGQYRGPDDDVDQDGDSFVGVDPITGNRIYDPDGVDEDYWNGRDDDGDGMVDEDKDGGFTEPETQAIRELMKKLDIVDEDAEEYPDGDRPDYHDGKSNVIMAMSYHSYSALVIWPWGYTYEDPEHEGLLRTVGTRMMDITDYGSWKDQGGYKVSGEWGDYMYGAHGTLSYTMELNTGSQGGFHPLEEMIIPTCRMLLGCNLYISRIANEAKVGRDNGYHDLDVDAPYIAYDQEMTEVDDGKSFPLKVTVGNATNLDVNGVKVYYRVDGGEWHARDLSGSGDSYKGWIPGQDAGTVVEFYFETDDSRGAMFHTMKAGCCSFTYKVAEKQDEFDAALISGLAIVILIALIAALLLRRRSAY